MEFATDVTGSSFRNECRFGEPQAGGFASSCVGLAAALALACLLPQAAWAGMRVFEINDHLLAFYDGRPAEVEVAHLPQTWMATGAQNVGVCTYVIHRGDTALVYDTFPSVRQAREVRAHLERLGIRHFTLVNSHWHLDHVGGNAAYADSARIATERTIGMLSSKLAAIEAGTAWGPPAIRPLVLPTIGIRDEVRVHVGDIDVDLRPVEIHSADGLVIYLPKDRLLLAGDTLEDTVTFVSEPERIEAHLANLERMQQWDIARILPNHGNPTVISAGGYPPSLIQATRDYLSVLRARVHEPDFIHLPLEEAAADALARGWVSLWWAYRGAHEENLRRMVAAFAPQAQPY